jgi:nitroimidazol reductase NimA-like FMN-containing flavoprotein (pyridoxamine 5'-phosphate oxidase superfamily)
METTQSAPLVRMTEAEALELLGTQQVGRLVYTRRALPAVTPVNFVLRDDAIWIWTASVGSMAQAVRGAVVAFEVDQLDEASRSGWSVVALGVAELVVNRPEIERAMQVGPEPWVSGRKEHLLRIPLKMISGRRIRTPAHAAGTVRAGDAAQAAEARPAPDGRGTLAQDGP